MIYLVRHGRTEFNAEGRFQGHLDSPLTPLGVEQAERGWETCCKRPDRRSIALVVLVASPLGRTLRTAEIIAGAARVRGLDFPRSNRAWPRSASALWDGLGPRGHRRGLPEHPAGSTWHDFFFRAPGGETYDQVAARLGDWLAEATGRRPAPRIVVSHGAAGWVLRGLYAGLPKAEVLTLPAPPQDTIFRLSEGRIERIDCAPAEPERPTSLAFQRWER